MSVILMIFFKHQIIRIKLNHLQMQNKEVQKKRPFFVVLNSKGLPQSKVGLMTAE